MAGQWYETEARLSKDEADGIQQVVPLLSKAVIDFGSCSHPPSGLYKRFGEWLIKIRLAMVQHAAAFLSRPRTHEPSDVTSIVPWKSPWREYCRDALAPFQMVSVVPANHFKTNEARIILAVYPPWKDGQQPTRMQDRHLDTVLSYCHLLYTEFD